MNGLLGTLLLTALLCQPAAASPFLQTGDVLLRHDVQTLADAGYLPGPVSTWPLAWGPVLAALNDIDDDVLPVNVAVAVQRLRERARWETREHEFTYALALEAAEKPTTIRGYRNTPRGRGGVDGSLSWIGRRVAIKLDAQVINSDERGAELRGDGSFVGATFGNYTLSLNTLDRWWGPGWDGSLILSNNARPVPAVSLDRNFTDPFESRWLRWIGPWDLSVFMGQLEGDRVVSDALLFGMRLAFRPVPSLEVGLSRSAQWCGDGRSCSSSTFMDLLIGRDNRGDDGLDISTEPGNQMAGLDLRWSTQLLGQQAALYGQFIGEDEAGGFPSRYLGQLGVEFSGVWGAKRVWRSFVEYAGTSCQFHESSAIYNCGYNHSVYQTGYRYRNRPIGHGADNDAELVSAGLFVAEDNGNEWQALLRAGTLNADGATDPWHTITATPLDIGSFDVVHSRVFSFGTVEAGAGVERQSAPGGDSRNEVRFYLQWRSGY